MEEGKRFQPKVKSERRDTRSERDARSFPPFVPTDGEELFQLIFGNSSIELVKDFGFVND